MQDVKHCHYEKVPAHGIMYDLQIDMDKTELEKACPTTEGYQPFQFINFICEDRIWKVKDQCPCAEGYDNNGVVGGECKSACEEEWKFFYDDPTPRLVRRLEVGSEKQLSCPTTTGYAVGSFKVKCLDDKKLVISDDKCECNATEHYKKITGKCLKYCDAVPEYTVFDLVLRMTEAVDGSTQTRFCPQKEVSGYIGGNFKIQCINTQFRISTVCECAPGYKLVDYKCLPELVMF